MKSSFPNCDKRQSKEMSLQCQSKFVDYFLEKSLYIKSSSYKYIHEELFPKT